MHWLEKHEIIHAIPICHYNFGRVYDFFIASCSCFLARLDIKSGKYYFGLLCSTGNGFRNMPGPIYQRVRNNILQCDWKLDLNWKKNVNNKQKE